MPKYQIKVIYDTGDSFNHYTDQVGYIESFGTEENKWEQEVLQFNSLRIGKENLKRIQEHHVWYLDANSFGRFYFNEKESEDKNKEATGKPWYNNSKDSLILLDNNKKPAKVTAFYHGHFETLRSVELESIGEELKIEF